jgi:hypothetical protein
MRRIPAIAATVVVLALGGARTSRAQVPEAQPLAVGAVAPDFALPAATRFGALREPVRLSAFKGSTVVLAFFFKARTPG